MRAKEETGPTVVKLGGSLVEAPELPAWLEAIAASSGSWVVVPGGGPFADAVRAAQGPMTLSEPACHRMALLAMAQLGCALVDREPRLLAAVSVAAVQAALAARRTPVWLPLDLLTSRAEIEESWRVTSDSLAAWLATEIGAARLLLVKSGAVPDGDHPARSLARSGLVDAAFLDYRGRFRGEVRLLHRAPADLRADRGCRCMP